MSGESTRVPVLSIGGLGFPHGRRSFEGLPPHSLNGNFHPILPSGFEGFLRSHSASGKGWEFLAPHCWNGRVVDSGDISPRPPKLTPGELERGHVTHAKHEVCEFALFGVLLSERNVEKRVLEHLLLRPLRKEALQVGKENWKQR